MGRSDNETSSERDAPYRLIVEGVRDHAIFMLDPQGRVASWNLGAQRMKGYTAEEIVGQHFSKFYPPEVVARGWPAYELEVATREGQFEDEGWRVRKDGSRFWANVAITALRDPDGTLVGYAKVTRDLSERRKQDEALRQSEERFRLLVENVEAYAIYMLDPRGRVASWNLGAERIKGYKAEEIIGQHFSRFFVPEDVERGWPDHELAVARREGRFEDEGWRVRKDGSRFWANAVITAVRDSAGELRGFAKLTRDLTQRRQVEALQENRRRTNEFLAMLGHELRNPLAALRNAAAILRVGDGSAHTWAQQVIERQVLHLDRIVDDLVDLARIDAGKITVRRERLDFPAVVRSAVDALRPQLALKGQHIAVSVPAEPVYVVGDPTRLFQVVGNLLANAHKYTPHGGHIEVHVEVDPGDSHLELRVRDDGIGMAPEQLTLVFDPFFQGERSLDRADGGLGIGLTLVRRLLDLHAGTVTAASAGRGQGSEFLVRLPVVEPPAPAVPAPEPEPPRGEARRVLVVDDNVDAAQSLALLVQLWGHEVRVVHDGPAAVEAAGAFAPDVVLLDIGLPGMDGYAVAERLRDSGALLVALSGYGQDEDVARSRRAGCAVHLVKPVDPRRLQALLADAPRRREAVTGRETGSAL